MFVENNITRDDNLLGTGDKYKPTILMTRKTDVYSLYASLRVVFTVIQVYSFNTTGVIRGTGSVMNLYHAWTKQHSESSEVRLPSLREQEIRCRRVAIRIDKSLDRQDVVHFPRMLKTRACECGSLACVVHKGKDQDA